MYTKILLYITLLVPLNCISKESMYFGMLSYHYNRDINYNEDNHKLIGYEKDGYFIETFKNSNRRRTVYVGVVDKELYCFSATVCAGGDAGFISGYEFKWVLFPMINIKINKDFDTDIIFGYDQVVAFRFVYHL